MGYDTWSSLQSCEEALQISPFSKVFGVGRSARKKPGPLPDFVIVGAQRCGTTFLYDLLSRHPRVEPATKKEVHYFDLHYGRGIEWYRSHFPRVERGSITGESSPYYLFHPHAAGRMVEVIPRVRLIALLRNPVERAYSGYHHEVRRGNETLGFEEAVEAEEARLRGEKKKMLVDEHYVSPNYQRFSYLSRGIYVDQLVHWSRYFPGDQMLVLKSEDLFDWLPETLGHILAFLGLPDWKPAVSDGGLEGRYPPMHPATRHRLRDYFEPHNRRLYEYLGVDFGW
jgi:hypothetical protein